MNTRVRLKKYRTKRKYGDQMSVSLPIKLDQHIRHQFSSKGYVTQGAYLRFLVELGASTSGVWETEEK